MFEINLCDIPELHSNKEVWRSFIIEKIRQTGLKPQEIPFTGPFGDGLNILLDIPPFLGSANGIRLLGAHYDGLELHDNIGGVLGLLHLVQFLATHDTKHAWRLAFWDLEERFQQGSRAYIKEWDQGDKSALGFKDHSIYLDIDGLGFGSMMFVREVLQFDPDLAKSEPQDHEFLMDCQNFASWGLPTYHVFSGPQPFEVEYAKAGLGGCWQFMLSENLATEENWWRTTPISLGYLERLINAWEYTPFGSACGLTGLKWLKKY